MIRPFFRWLLLATIASIFAARVGLCADINAQAICRINNGDSAGSGCLVGVDESTGLVVTCHHLFTDGNFGPVVTFPNGQRMPAQIVADDPTNDVTALAIARPNVQPVPLANYRPDKGEKLASAGYGSNSVLAVNYGMVDRHADMGDGTYASIRLTGTVRSGDSGGPVFNSRGELAAIIWGGNDEGVYAAGSHVVNVALTQCRGGVCQPYRIIQQPQQWRPAAGAPNYQQPPLVQVPPKPQAPAQPACQCKDYEPRLEKIEAAIASGALKGEPGPAGADGKPGRDGAPGKTGERGPAGVIDQAAISAAVKAELSKQLGELQLPVRIVGPNRQTNDLTVPLDGKHRLTLDMSEKPGTRAPGSKGRK